MPDCNKNGLDSMNNRAEQDNRRGSKVVVVTAYVSAYPEPVRVHRGDRLQIDLRRNEYEGWVWATTEDDNSGWMPQSYLETVSGSETAVATRDYDATELTVKPGDELDVLESESNWLLVRSADGRVGWVPENHTKAL
jgi:uncharacterized protein YgiM (DUF1202 family)